MAVITFYTHGKDQTGNTVSAISFATFLGLTKNKKTLLISTGYKDNTVSESLWPIEKQRKSFFADAMQKYAPKQEVFQRGIDSLDRIVRSNKLEPNIITNYTRVALNDKRLEVIDSYMGDKGQFEQIQESYPKVIAAASRYYDNVIVDIDKRLNQQTKEEILNVSDIVLAMSIQKAHNVEQIKKLIDEKKCLKPENTLVTLGRYDKNMKYNAKNLARTILKQRKPLDTIPYNSQIAEAIQEGRVIDVIFGILNLRNADESYFFVQELQRLVDDIDEKVLQIEMRE